MGNAPSSSSKKISRTKSKEPSPLHHSAYDPNDTSTVSRPVPAGRSGALSAAQGTNGESMSIKSSKKKGKGRASSVDSKSDGGAPTAATLNAAGADDDARKRNGSTDADDGEAKGITPVPTGENQVSRWSSSPRAREQEARRGVSGIGVLPAARSACRRGGGCCWQGSSKGPWAPLSRARRRGYAPARETALGIRGGVAACRPSDARSARGPRPLAPSALHLSLLDCC